MSTRSIKRLAIVVCLLGSYCTIGFHQADEHYQILEFAAMRAGHTPAADLPWEYGEQMRPGLQPFLAYTVYRIVGNPFWTAFLLRLLSGLFTLGIAWLVFRRYAGHIESAKWLKWFAGACFLHWAMWYSGWRFSSETWSGLTFALGFLLYPMRTTFDRLTVFPHLSSPRGSDQSASRFAPYVGVGFLFGLAFCFRYQVAILVLGFGAWLLLIVRERWWRLALLVLGGLLALALGSLADRWLYGEWVNAPWNYLAQNLIEGKAATFGSRPWWGYFELVFLRGIPPLGILYIVAPLLFFWRYRRDPITWSWGLFLLLHFILSRKDVRFLFPLLPLLPIVLLGAARYLYDGFFSRQSRVGENGLPRVASVHRSRDTPNFYAKDFRVGRIWRIGLWLCLLTNFVLLSVNVFRPLRPSLTAAKYLYDHAPVNATIVVGLEHPYAFYGLPAHFYRRSDLSVVAQCPPGVDCLYLYCQTGAEPPSPEHLLWTNRPSWLPEVGVAWYWVTTRPRGGG